MRPVDTREMTTRLIAALAPAGRLLKATEDAVLAALKLGAAFVLIAVVSASFAVVTHFETLDVEPTEEAELEERTRRRT